MYDFVQIAQGTDQICPRIGTINVLQLLAITNNICKKQKH